MVAWTRSPVIAIALPVVLATGCAAAAAMSSSDTATLAGQAVAAQFGARGVSSIRPGTVRRGTQVFVVGADGLGLRQLTSGAVFHRVLLWMPGDAAVANVAYTGSFPQKNWVQSQTISGRGHRDLSATVSTVSAPWPMTFSVASRLAAVEMQGPQGLALERVGPPASRPRVLDRWSIQWGNGSYMAVWSPNGRLIAYVRAIGPLHASKPNMGAALRIAVTTADGQQHRILTPLQVCNDPAPAFSPDGRSIVFCVAGPRGGLYTAPTGGGPARRVSHVRGVQLAWSPNGREIAYAANRGQDLLVTDLRTGRIRRFPGPVAGAPTASAENSGPVISPLAWSPNGKTIAFVQSPPVRTSFSSPTFRIETLNIRTGRSRILVRGHTATLFGPTWSRDGRQIAFTVGPPLNPFY